MVLLLVVDIRVIRVRLRRLHTNSHEPPRRLAECHELGLAMGRGGGQPDERLLRSRRLVVVVVVVALPWLAAGGGAGAGGALLGFAVPDDDVEAAAVVVAVWGVLFLGEGLSFVYKCSEHIGRGFQCKPIRKKRPTDPTTPAQTKHARTGCAAAPPRPRSPRARSGSWAGWGTSRRGCRWR